MQNDSVCLPSGLDCYKQNVTVKDDDCILPCKGVYADVVKHTEDLQDKKYFNHVLDKYKKYKSGFNDEGDLLLSFSYL